MPNNYQGFLIKFGSYGVIPLNYIMEYSSTPCQRMESDAQRDQNGNLHRATLPNTKTSIKFTTHILDLTEKITLQNLMNYSNSVQRKVQVTFWNDEINDYSTSWFYIPDIEFTVMDASTNDIKYNPITVELIEY